LILLLAGINDVIIFFKKEGGNKTPNNHQNNTILKSNIYIRLAKDYLPHERPG